MTKAHDVVDEAFLQALNRDEHRWRRWVAIVDGNEEQLRRIPAMADNYGVEVTIVVDFIHVLGYLWKAGKALEGDDPSAIEAWVTERSTRILYGQASTVAAAMRRSATARGLAGAARGAVDDCARYLLNHNAHRRYHEYQPDGLPIASEVIEGACRSLVRDRMDITGARWGLPGGEAVLKLRSLAASGDPDQYLDYHARREPERNHLSKFDEHERDCPKRPEFCRRDLLTLYFSVDRLRAPGNGRRVGIISEPHTSHGRRARHLASTAHNLPGRLLFMP